jgi:hypothetical protein
MARPRARVLAGAGELIVASQPLISVEVLDRVDPAPLEQIRADLGYVDISLSAQEAIVGWPRVQVVADAPNHLLVPPDRLEAVLEDLRSMRSLRVSAPG